MHMLTVANADCQTHHTLHHSNTYTPGPRGTTLRAWRTAIDIELSAGHDKQFVDATSGSYETDVRDAHLIFRHRASYI